MHAGTVWVMWVSAFENIQISMLEWSLAYDHIIDLLWYFLVDFDEEEAQAEVEGDSSDDEVLVNFDADEHDSSGEEDQLDDENAGE